jgi:hypothetical protein
MLARLAAETAEQERAAAAADRKAESLAQARREALAASDRWNRREMLVHKQVDALDAQAQAIETEAETLALEHDVLARVRDDARESLMKARARAGSFAVLPYKGPTGTWQRPIVIECRDGSSTLQPNGPSFSLLEMTGGANTLRADPFITAIAHEMLKAQAALTPDGASCVPYILFVVRPDGIRPYYVARTRLEPLGVAFGYELVEQDEEIDFPDLDDPAQWDDVAPTRPNAGQVAQRWPNQTLGTGSGGSDLKGEGIRGEGGSGEGGTARSNGGAGNGGGGAPGFGGAGNGSGSGGGGGGNVGWPSGQPGRYGNIDPRSGQTAMQRVLSGPPGRYYANRSMPRGEPPEGDGGPASSESLPPSARRPGSSGSNAKGRVEIVPRDSYGESGMPGPRINRLVTLDELPAAAGVSPGGQPGAGNESSPGGLPPMPAGGGSSFLGAPRGNATLLADAGGASTGSGSSGSNSSSLAGEPPGGLGRFLANAAGGQARSAPAGGRQGQGGQLAPGVQPTQDGQLPPGGQPNQNGQLPPEGKPNQVELLAPDGMPATEGELSPGGQSSQSGQPSIDRPISQGSAAGSAGAQGSSNSAGSPPQGSGSQGSSTPPPRMGQSQGSASGLPQLPSSSSSAGGGNMAGMPAGMPTPTLTNRSAAMALDEMEPPKRSHDEKPVPEGVLQMVVVCGRDGLTLEPGGRQLRLAELKANNGMLLTSLQSIVRSKQQAEPLTFWHPRVHFLIEPGGDASYREARRQTILAGNGWPVTLQIAAADSLRLNTQERR